MIKSYRKLSGKTKIILFIITIPFSALLGGIVGFMIGLISTTFIPSCCDEGGCHSCAEFGGRFGYEATSILGFWIGLVLFLVLYITLIIYFATKKRK